MPNKVFIVTFGIDSISCVCSSEEKALAYINKQPDDHKQYYDVTPYTIDEDTE